MDRGTYDPAGSVAVAGGITGAIQAAMSSNEGYSLYLHSKSGNVHALTNTAGGSVIRFIATADFVDNDTFTVNGTVCAAKTIDGTLIEGGFFVSGAVVTGIYDGTSLYFKSGSAIGLNFTVVGGTTQPTLPKENTIWVNTSVPITSYGFSPGQPSAFQGRVWIQTSLASPAQFNALKPGDAGSGYYKRSLLICPVSAQIYNGSSWVNVTSASKIYQGGVWKPLMTILYELGNDNPTITGGFSKAPFIAGGSTFNNLSVANNGTNLVITGNDGAWATNNAVSLTGVNTVRMRLTCSKTNGSNIANIVVGSTRSNLYYNNVAVYTAVPVVASFTDYIMNVTSLTGAYYIGGTHSSVAGSSITTTVQSIILE